MDSDERVTDWNPAAATLFGYSADEALGRPIDDLVIGDAGRDEGREVTREAIATGRAQRITRRRRKDGTAVDVELMLAPLSVEGAHVGFLAIYHDLTEVQRAREHAETLLTVTQVLGKTLSLEDTIETIIGELQRVVPYDSCSVQVIQGNRLVIVGGRGFDDLEFLLGQGFDLDDESSLNSHVVRSKRTQVFADVSENPHFASDFGGCGAHSRLDLRADDRRRPCRRCDQRRQVRARLLRRGARRGCDRFRRPGGNRDRERPSARDGARRPPGGRDVAGSGPLARQRHGCAAGLRPDPDGAPQGGALSRCEPSAVRRQRAGDRRRPGLSEPRRADRSPLRLAGSRRSCP